LRSCINVSGLCLERRYAPGHHGCQRARGLISGQASKRAKRVTRVRMRREDRSSISSRPLADLGGKRDYVIVSPSSVPLFVPSAVPFVPACSTCRAPRAGAVKAGRSSRPPAGLGLDGPSTVPGSDR
jgi:hypothetical protein